MTDLVFGVLKYVRHESEANRVRYPGPKEVVVSRDTWRYRKKELLMTQGENPSFRLAGIHIWIAISFFEVPSIWIIILLGLLNLNLEIPKV